MGFSITQNQRDGFAAKVAIILLLSCLILQVSSIAGLSTSITSIFPSYAQLVLIVLIIGLILFGVVGFWRKSSTAAYPTILISVILIGLSAASFTACYVNGQFAVNSSITFLIWSLMGVFLLISVWKSAPQQQTLTKEALSADAYAIQTINAGKDYVLASNTVSAVKDLNLLIKKGDFVAIMGPSGSGKSTVLNLLGALDRPSSGRILIGGVDISNLNENELAKLRNQKIGFIFQAYNLIPRSTVTRNIELPALVKGYSKEQRQQKISYLLDNVGLRSKASVKPKTLSGGEQQRIAVCRALINDPEIILADEPTGNLDSKTGQSIMAFLRKLNSEKRTTIVVVTHDPEVAKRTDKIIYFRDGTIQREEVTSAVILA